jgi:hypothetical protein
VQRACVLCRLDDRRRRQRVLRRFWLAVSGASFLVIAGFALLNNRPQGIALLALGAAIIAIAVVYDRVLRRR